jgi:hypothetical protein
MWKKNSFLFILRISFPPVSSRFQALFISVLVLSICILLSILSPLLQNRTWAYFYFQIARARIVFSPPPSYFHNVYKSRIRKKHVCVCVRERERKRAEPMKNTLISSSPPGVLYLQRSNQPITNQSPTNQPINQSSLRKKGRRCLEAGREGNWLSQDKLGPIGDLF